MAAALKALNITEETAAVALPSVQAAAAFDYSLMAMNVLERVLAMLLHIGLTVIVYYGVVNGKKIFLPLAILLHMLMDTFPALYQRGVVPLWAVEAYVGRQVSRPAEPQQNRHPKRITIFQRPGDTPESD